MNRREWKDVGLKDIEKEPDLTRYVLILDDERHVVVRWADIFDKVWGVRFVAPKIGVGFSEELIKRMDPTKISFVVVDWFGDLFVPIHEECQKIISWIRLTNPEVFILEGSFASNGQRAYEGTNLSVDTFNLFDDPRFDSMKKDHPDKVEGVIFALLQLVVPELALSADLDRQTGVSQPELFHLFFQLQKNPKYCEILDELEIEDDALEGRLLRMSRDDVRVFLHCAYNYLAQRKLDHDERYYSMALSRMRTMIEDVRKPGPSV